jgi:hypothetical protein
MKWFKHYTDASNGKFLNTIMDEFGVEGYAWYFMILELCAEKWDGKGAPIFTFHQRVLLQKLRIRKLKLHSYLTKVQLECGFSYTITQHLIQIEVPKLSEYIGSRLQRIDTDPRLKTQTQIEDRLLPFFDSLKPEKKSRHDIPQQFIDEFGLTVLERDWSKSFDYYHSKKTKKDFWVFMYEAMCRTRDFLGVSKADEDRINELMKKMDAE